VGKNTTCSNLGIGLAGEGKRVLLIDGDPQASLTISLGNPYPDQIQATLTELLGKTLKKESLSEKEGIIHHAEGIDLIPANIELSGMEVSLVSVWGREKVLRRYIETIQYEYDYILIDCMPSLGMLTINALTAADSVLIPVQAQYLPVKGVEQLLNTIAQVRQELNENLHIAGVLLTMVDYRTNYANEISKLLRETCADEIPIFASEIPQSIRAAETSYHAKSIYTHDPRGKVADAYRVLTKEVLEIG
jgi:chromosome partitioning protein